MGLSQQLPGFTKHGKISSAAMANIRYFLLNADACFAILADSSGCQADPQRRA
jgi:hypothetical protein